MNTENIKQPAFCPLADRIMVLPLEGASMTPSGIIIPDTAKEAPVRGQIVRLGTGLADKTFQVKVGDEVGYSKYAGSEIKVDGIEYKVLRETDVIGIYENVN
jgi:chaperonin GroES